MSRIYAIQLDYNVTEGQYHRLLSELSEEKQKTIQRFVFREDALRSLVADLLVRKIIRTELQISNDQIQFETNTYGKPFVKGLPSFHFNISHSGNWVVCATDDQPVGIDIEQVRPIEFEIAERFFSESEIRDLEEKTGKAKQSYFYDLWSLKESYIKMVGKGLSIPLNSFSCRVINSQVYFSSVQEQIPAYFRQYEVDPQYKLAVCQSHPHFPKSVQRISLETIVTAF
ncbi:4'-phosphopantetheinyl transferase superfamily protein [Halalkalibacterium halodurans]|uniref:4'-phosphopantetheinyl transferase family protein n=1 Tax=Halalkalibacterium halodurans TaxID=86665 RepID=UPI0010684BC9|nr:4'-phosphopantetheinyl transferase superfamily protein [Halalkalibacterium halodurans]TES55760.1 4'-phosphopantetheinyl transferase superfamily protein [Halalkalibacterium halodurans]